MPALGAPFAAGLVLILLWEGLARLPGAEVLLAGPWDVALWLRENAGLMGRALAVTGAEAAAGFVLGNLAAVALALLAFALPRAERLIAALALLVFCLPLVATGPILRVLYGPGPGPQITLAALAVYYTTFVPLLVGLRAAPATWFDMVASYGRGHVAALIHVRLFAALPYLVAGLQIAAPAAFLGAMVGEFTGAERGMGVLTIRALRALDVEATWALATVAALVSIAVYAAIGRAGRRLLNAPPPVLLAPPSAARGPSPGRLLLRAGLAGAVALALWWGAMEAFDLNRFFAKRPGDVWAFLVTRPEAGAHRAELFGALGETLALAVPGYLAGLALGAALAVGLTLAPRAASLAMPVAVTLRAVPIVTTAPLIVLLMGRGPAGTIALVAVMIFFPVFVACLHGLARAPGQVLDVFDSYAAGPVQRLLHAQLPAMLPAFFASARMSLPAAMLAVTVVEWLATGRGVGALMALSASLSDYAMLWSAVVVVALATVAGHALLGAAEGRVLARYAGEQLR
ncbi:ABC transporter permease [Rhodosalinus halophilus]|uniref:ABC transporter permease n=1 Tax=Rhodosalinus halophilus TaxID=2259333 RepID=A0A365U5Q7_9RHOB|nr:ABC transporter permease [Rhodosalinus halophilus]